MGDRRWDKGDRRWDKGDRRWDKGDRRWKEGRKMRNCEGINTRYTLWLIGLTLSFVFKP
jgi:hypothetical protein